MKVLSAGCAHVGLKLQSAKHPIPHTEHTSHVFAQHVLVPAVMNAMQCGCVDDPFDPPWKRWDQLSVQPELVNQIDLSHQRNQPWRKDKPKSKSGDQVAWSHKIETTLAQTCAEIIIFTAVMNYMVGPEPRDVMSCPMITVEHEIICNEASPECQRLIFITEHICDPQLGPEGFRQSIRPVHECDILGQQEQHSTGHRSHAVIQPRNMLWPLLHRHDEEHHYPFPRAGEKEHWSEHRNEIIVHKTDRVAGHLHRINEPQWKQDVQSQRRETDTTLLRDDCKINGESRSVQEQRSEH